MTLDASPTKPVGTTTQDRTIDGPHGPLKLRIYEPAADVALGIGFVWVHGGAYAFGDLDFPEAHGVCLQLAARGVTTVSVDYQVAPTPSVYTDIGVPAHEGVHYPVAAEEVTAAFRWASEESGIPAAHWSLGGGSAGATLSAGACLRLRDQGHALPRSLVLAYGALHAQLPAPSPELALKVVDAPYNGVRNSPENFAVIALNYVGDKKHLSSPYAFPGGHDLRGLPPVFVLNSDADDIRASGELFASELAAAGVDVLQIREDGTHHGHFLNPEAPASIRGIGRIVTWLSTPDLLGTAHERP